MVELGLKPAWLLEEVAEAAGTGKGEGEGTSEGPGEGMSEGYGHWHGRERR